MAELPRSPRKPRVALSHVFVDFENVPTVDLGLIGDHRAEIALLIGEKQRRLELGLVRQIHQYAANLTLIEVGASGRNALDLVLAYHLGKAAERYPADPFFIVSKDKDFDPLLTHLRTQGLEITRVDTFADLPFLARGGLTKKSADSNRTTVAAAPTVPKLKPIKVSPVPVRPPVEEQLAKIIDRFQQKTKARPARRKTLLSHLNGFYKNQLSETELEAIVQNLERRGIVQIDLNGRVSYPGSTV